MNLATVCIHLCNSLHINSSECPIEFNGTSTVWGETLNFKYSIWAFEFQIQLYISSTKLFFFILFWGSLVQSSAIKSDNEWISPEEFSYSCYFTLKEGTRHPANIWSSQWGGAALQHIFWLCLLKLTLLLDLMGLTSNFWSQAGIWLPMPTLIGSNSRC